MKLLTQIRFLNESTSIESTSTAADMNHMNLSTVPLDQCQFMLIAVPPSVNNVSVMPPSPAINPMHAVQSLSNQRTVMEIMGAMPTENPRLARTPIPT